ncbi:MAG: ABC transporter ATP-binding protein [Sarcina sp.]
MEIIKVKNLNKLYKVYEKKEGLKNTIKDLFNRKYSYKKSVNNLSFTILKGEIVGLLGDNGAGKTTTLKMLAGILYPTSGIIEVLGYTPTERKKEYMRKICFVMGNKRDINWDLPAIDSFKYQQLIYEIPEDVFRKNLKEMATLLHVENLLGIQLRKLSLGERMKMELINNFLYLPEVIFLDEPTIGLDLKSQISVRKFIKEYSKRYQATIIITSHYMDDIEETCDKVILLQNGNEVFKGNISELESNSSTFKEEIIRRLK